jgi:hypothetical protein
MHVRDIGLFLKGRKPSVTLDRPTNGALPYILIENFNGVYTTYTNDGLCTTVRCV